MAATISVSLPLLLALAVLIFLTGAACGYVFFRAYHCFSIYQFDTKKQESVCSLPEAVRDWSPAPGVSAPAPIPASDLTVPCSAMQTKERHFDPWKAFRSNPDEWANLKIDVESGVRQLTIMDKPDLPALPPAVHFNDVHEDGPPVRAVVRPAPGLVADAKESDEKGLSYVPLILPSAAVICTPFTPSVNSGLRNEVTDCLSSSPGARPPVPRPHQRPDFTLAKNYQLRRIQRKLREQVRERLAQAKLDDIVEVIEDNKETCQPLPPVVVPVEQTVAQAPDFSPAVPSGRTSRMLHRSPPVKRPANAIRSTVLKPVGNIRLAKKVDKPAPARPSCVPHSRSPSATKADKKLFPALGVPRPLEVAAPRSPKGGAVVVRNNEIFPNPATGAPLRRLPSPPSKAAVRTSPPKVTGKAPAVAKRPFY